MARLSRSERESNSLEVAQLADHNNVGIFTQRRAQRVRETACVAMHLALIDQAALTFMNEFDRVFDGQNMLRFGLVQIVNERRECRALTRTSRPSDDNQASRCIGDSFENGPKT